MDALAILAASDPFAVLMAGVWLFAAGMYPLAFMLGSECSACCACELCEEGSLPDTLTVTFSGLADQTPGPDLISMEIDSCFGSGASARVAAPGGDPATDAGPISKVEVLSGGSGYALLGRVAPTITISGAGGSGATFTPTLAVETDACGVPTWAIESVAVSGGTGYINGEPVYAAIASGDTEQEVAEMVVLTGTEPTLSIGGNATATITLVDNKNGTWGVDSITVTDGGSGYVDGDPLVIEFDGDDVEVHPASGVYRTVRLQPTVAAEPFQASGTGAVLTVTLTATTDGYGRDAWTVGSVGITTAGSGYTVGDWINAYNTTPGGYGDGGYVIGEVTSVNGSGGITGISASGGLYYDLSDELDDVEVSYDGEYYSESGTPQSVTVADGGAYYREDPDEDPYVSSVTITISQAFPSAGAGAVLTAVVDDDTASETFGEILSITITDAGDGYLAWEWRNTKCCGGYYNGMSVVVKRNAENIETGGYQGLCLYGHRMCGVGNMQAEAGHVRVEYYGPATPPKVFLVSEWTIREDGTSSVDANPSTICNLEFTANANVTDCGEWSELSFTAPGGEIATVSAGGEYDLTFRNPNATVDSAACHICCKGEEPLADEIVATVTDNRAFKPLGDVSGDYVLTRFYPPMGAIFHYQIADPMAPIQLSISPAPCASQTTGEFGDFASGDCEHCHAKCIVWASLFVPPNSNFGIDGAIDGDYCGLCEDTPLCDLTGREWTLGGGNFGVTT